MPLQTAPFPIIFILIFFVLPIFALVGIIAGALWYFWRFRDRPKLIMAGAVILLFYGLGTTYLAIAANLHNSYLVKVETCDQHKITGYLNDGRDIAVDGQKITLYFPRLFGSGHSEFGAGPAVETIDQDENWGSDYPAMICKDILGTVTLFDTDGLKRIELVKFFGRENPLTYSLPENIGVEKTSNFSSGWFSETNDNLSDRSTNCLGLAEAYNNTTQITYNFLADIEKLRSQGNDPENFGFRVYVLPNLTNYQNLEELNYDWESCYSPEHANAFPLLVSSSWIAFADGCEGILVGCTTAQDAIKNGLKLGE